LAEELGVADATENDLYGAMDWLGERQERMEKKLAARHLQQGGLVLYDVSSRFYEGRTCPLAKLGHDRDGQKGLPIMVNGEGCPVAVEVYAGNSGDPTTVADQIEKLRERFGWMQVVLAGDRGMLTQPQINQLKDHPGLRWITALTSVAIGELVTQGALQRSLLDQKNLAEITSPGVCGGTVGGLPQPVAGAGAKAQAGRVAGSDGETFGADPARSGTAEEEATGRGPNWGEGGEGVGTVQDGKALRL
jgi:hypothetical protein